MDLQTQWTDNPGEVGTIDVLINEGAYLGAFIGRPQAIADHLEAQGYFGLTAYVRKIKPKRPIGYLSGIEVEEQGKGLGSRMVDTMLKEMERLGVREVYLYRSASERSSDTDLERFYSRFGFENVDCCDEDVWPVMVLRW